MTALPTNSAKTDYIHGRTERGFRVADTKRILGIDTSLRSTGVGLVEATGNRHRLIASATLKNPRARPLSACLANLQSEITRLVSAYTPDAVAIESIFFCRNARTALLLGHARGVAIAACATASLPVFEYEPRRVKQAVVGFGGASKEQVQQMICSLLGLRVPPPEDEADALAIAICHLHSQGRLAAVSEQTKQI